jgi:hypothetical protein
MATGTAGSTARDYHTSQRSYLKRTIAYNTAASGTAVTLGTIPANSCVVGVLAVVTTAFNSGSGLLDVGTTGTSNAYADDLVVTSVGVKSNTNLATGASAVIKPTTDTVVTATFTQSGATASAGSCDVILEFVNA